MNSLQVDLIKQASHAIIDCSDHLQDAANELQRVINVLTDIVNFDKEDMEEML